MTSYITKKEKEKEGHLKTKTIQFGFDKGYIKKKAKTKEIIEVDTPTEHYELPEKKKNYIKKVFRLSV